MNKLNPWKLSTVALAGALAFTLASTSMPEAEAGAQPHMRAALAKLESARKSLKKAKPNKGGHRVKAIAAVNTAIKQVKKGIAHANNN